MTDADTTAPDAAAADPAPAAGPPPTDPVPAETAPPDAASSGRAPIDSRNRDKARGGRRPGTRAVLGPDELAKLPVPDELVRFNAMLAAEKAAHAADKREKKEAEATARRLADAEQAKEAAARRIRELTSNPNASRDDKETAEQAYKDAVATLQAVQRGEEPPAPSTPPDTTPTAELEADADEDASAGPDEDASAGPDEDAPADAEGDADADATE